jgi:hypothetical protein
MSTTHGRLPALTWSLALFAGWWAASDARADAIRYVSWGEVETKAPATGDDPDPTIHFNGLTSGSFDGSSPFSLGEFQVAPLPAGSSKTYVDAPFTIGVHFLGPSGDDSAAIAGRINGTITGGDASGLLATIDHITPLVSVDLIDGATAPTPSFTGKYFPLDALKVTGPFPIVAGPDAGDRPVLGQVTTAPEPSLVIAVGFLGLGWWGMRRLAA